MSEDTTNVKEKAESLADDIIGLFYIKDNNLLWDGPKIVDMLMEYRSEAVQAERERDIAGEVWDILVSHIRPLNNRSVTSVYDEMRAKFPILSADKESTNG